METLHALVGCRFPDINEYIFTYWKIFCVDSSNFISSNKERKANSTAWLLPDLYELYGDYNYIVRGHLEKKIFCLMNKGNLISKIKIYCSIFPGFTIWALYLETVSMGNFPVYFMVYNVFCIGIRKLR